MAKKNEIEFKIDGIEELIATLATLTPEIQNKSGRAAMRKLAKDMTATTKASVPVKTGNLFNSLKDRVRVMGSAKSVVAITYAKYDGKGDGSQGGNHAHLIEYGHKLVKGKYLGRKTIGFVPAQPFLRPTLFNYKDTWIKIAADGVALSLTKLKRRGKF